MLIDINLLPKKEKKQKRPITNIMIVVILFLIMASSILAFQIYSEKAQLAALSNELQATYQLRELEGQNVSDNETRQTMDQLKTSIAWIKQEQVDTVPILRKLTEILPERGFFTLLTYENKDSIQLTIQFDESRQAAFYLSQLNQANWVKKASLQSIEVSELSEVDAESSTRDESNVPLPRYLANYSISVDKQMMQAEMEEGGDS